MKFKKSIKNITREIKQTPLSRIESMRLYALVMIPLVFYSLITVGLLNYFATGRSNQSNDLAENWQKVVEPENNLTPVSLPYLPLNILLVMGAGICITSLVKKHHSSQGDLSIVKETVPEAELPIVFDPLKDRQHNCIAANQAEVINCESYALLAYMSHELRSPLNAILGFTQITKQELATAEVSQENLAIIDRSGKRLLEIINDVVDLAKIETNQFNLECNNIDFSLWLDELERNIHFQAARQGWRFSLTRQQNLPEVIYVDERRLGQILSNLIDYCLHSDSTSEIKLQVTIKNSTADNLPPNEQTSPPEQLCFQISNNTLAASATELATLFDPLARVQKEQKSDRGSSLNLPLSKKLSRLMKGDITVEANSTEDSGLAFNLVIATANTIIRQPANKPTVKEIIGLAPGQIEYRILVVDDSKTNRQIMTELLKPVGFQVREAVNGKQAIDVWLSWHPHMIWMDLKMPVMNGYEATERIKSYSHFNTPIVALSASTLEAEKLQFEAAGCDDFVGKPFTKNIIFEKIAQYLDVQYLYESAVPIIPASFRLTTDTLNVMPSQWLSQVEQAALVLDRDLLTNLMQKIPPEHQDLQNALQEQVDNFEFDRILNLARKSQGN